jgi:adenylate cyclase
MRTRALYKLMLVAAGVVSLAIAITAYGFHALKRADLSTVDARFSIRGDRTPPSDIVFVKIDTDSFDELNTQFPFPRKLHAQAIDNLARDGAKVIGYDVQFTEPSAHPAQDDRLVASAKRAGNVVLATTETTAKGETNIFDFGGPCDLKCSGATPSDTLLPNDPGNIIRRFEYEIDHLATFPMAVAAAANGRPVKPPSGSKSAWIDYVGPPGTIKSIPFWRVSKGQFPPGTFRGRIVVIGASAPSLQDLHPTSTTGQDEMPGPEILANAIDTVERGFPLSASPDWVNILIIVIMGATPVLLALLMRGTRAALLSLGLVALFAIVAQLLFNSGKIVSVLYAGIAALLSTIAVLIIYAITTAFERERARDTFARFVPEAVVGQVLDQADGVRLGGTRSECTLLFSDLRGFTSFSESRDPSEVLDILNRYLTAMSEAILDAGGTLVSYMGDGIMAVFGAPIQQPDHADRAVRASRDMLRELEKFNGWMRSEGHGDGFKMGIGLNTGGVMVGNVGSERRLEFTTIGDTVNTASRIEGMTKGTPNQLYLADSTRAALLDPPDELEDAGQFEVRGREEPIRLWTLPSTRFEQPAPTPEPVAG